MWTEEKPDLDELMHFGVLGMRWGHRKASSPGGKNSSKREGKDLEKLKTAMAKSSAAIKKNAEWNKSHTFGVSNAKKVGISSVVLTNPRLQAKANRQMYKAKKLMKKLNKKYKNVKAIPAKDKETGRAILKFTLGGMKGQIYDD